MKLITQRKDESETTYGRNAIVTIITDWRGIQSELQERSGHDISDNDAKRLFESLIKGNVEEFTIRHNNFLLILINK